jgi:hypothetical protein
LTANENKATIRKGNGRKGAVYRFIKIFGNRTNIGSMHACNKAIEIKLGTNYCILYWKEMEYPFGATNLLTRREM